LTFQAAMGAVPLSVGVKGGEIILALAVLSVLFTAPIGAMAMNVVGKKFLKEI